MSESTPDPYTAAREEHARNAITAAREVFAQGIGGKNSSEVASRLIWILQGVLYAHDALLADAERERDALAAVPRPHEGLRPIAIADELEGFSEGSTSARATLMRDAATVIRAQGAVLDAVPVSGASRITDDMVEADYEYAVLDYKRTGRWTAKTWEEARASIRSEMRGGGTKPVRHIARRRKAGKWEIVEPHFWRAALGEGSEQ